MKDHSKTPDQTAAEGLARPRVLVVDDVEDNRVVMRRRLQARGCEVVEAADGRQALDLLAREAFDAVMLDVIMPGMDGFEVLHAIRARHSARDLPVIMTTVKDAVQDVIEALREGANDYIVKPIDHALLRTRLNVQLERKQAEAEAGQSQPEMEGLVGDLRAALSEAEAEVRAKANFMADLSHEIRTPLNGILGVTKALAGEATDPQQARMLATVTDSAVALERLLSDALDLSRAEAGALEIRHERFELFPLVERCAGLFAPLAAAKGLDFRLEVSPEARVWVSGDWLRLQQILSNLINNAVKFTTEGSVSCTVTAEDGGGFRFEVRDTGVGFDEETASALFERFKQADSAIAARFGGTGLGLAISRRLAQLMDGDITASSRPQKGSLFTLRLPLTVADAQDAEAQPGAWPPAAVAPGRRARVLLAEDHPTNRLVVELMLRAGEVDLVSVENGAQAIEASREQDFDCILMDMEMPVMDGLTAIREIRRREGVQGSAPVTIFALSAHTSEDHRQLSSAAGADGHLTKPIHPDALLKALGQALASRGAATDAPAGERPGVALFSG